MSYRRKATKVNDQSERRLMSSRKNEVSTAVLDATGVPLLVNGVYLFNGRRVRVEWGSQFEAGNKDHFYRVFFMYIDAEGEEDLDAIHEEIFTYAESRPVPGGGVEYKTNLVPTKG